MAASTVALWSCGLFFLTGLLTGADMLDALKSEWKSPQVVVIPPNCVSHAGLFLDDLTPSDLADALGAEVVVGSYDLVQTIERITSGRKMEKGVGGDPPWAHPYISSRQMTS